MDRPLWQIWLALLAVSFAAQRVVVAVTFGAADGVGVLVVGYFVQAAVGLALALGIWLGRRWVLLVLPALWVAIAVTALLGAWAGVAAVAAAVGQVAVAAVSTGLLFLVLRHEFGER